MPVLLCPNSIAQTINVPIKYHFIITYALFIDDYDDIRILLWRQ